MAKKRQLTEEEILHLSYLAKLEVNEEEKRRYKAQLEETLNYISNLEELNTENVNQTGWRQDLENVYFRDGEKNKRSLSKDEVFKNAKNKKDNYFITKKIII